MELTRDNHYSFTLSIIGYQFPELEQVEYDSNWLNVKIVISDQRGKWSVVDPALLTYEVARLIDWLKAVSVRKYDERQLSFLEPYLSFRVSPAERDPDNLVIGLWHNLQPPWASEDQDEEYQIVFPLTSIDLIAAAKSLENELRLYPQRTER